jgi:hypothetical protein
VNRHTKICAVVGIGVFFFGPPASAATYPAQSCSVADIHAAASSATDGDTVLVPSGSCTWTTVLTIAQGLTLDGQGLAAITFGSGSGLTVNTDAIASAVVTGFTFNNGFTNGSYPISINTTTAPLNVAFHIYNDSLNDDGQQGGAVTLIGVSGVGPGLIDHNSFTTANGADEVIHLLGSGSTSDTSGWSNDVVPGGPNMVFLENNVFVNSSAVSTSAEEAYYGAQLVFRYNTLTFEANDIHQGGLSGRWAEIYDNSYEIGAATANLPDYWQFRGGSGLVFDNISSGTPCCQDPYPGAQFGPDCPSSDQCTGAWPIPSQVGTGINETTSSPVYVWGNAATVDGSTQSIQASLGYTNGTQHGGTPTACTHPGGVCDVVVTANAPATWVRCESAADVSAGCPVSYSYTPYTYPHPLDTLSTSCVGVGCPAATSFSTGGSTGNSGGTSGGSGTATSGSGTGTTGGNGGKGTTAGASTGGGASGTTGSGRGSTSSTAGTSGGAPSSSGGGTSGGSVVSSGGTTTSVDGGVAATVSGGCGCSTGSDAERLSFVILAVGLLASRWARRRLVRPPAVSLASSRSSSGGGAA